MTTTAIPEQRLARHRCAERLSGRAAELVPGSSLTAVRVVFGVVGAISTVRFVANGWIDQLYVDPAFHFRYPGLWWVPVPSRPVLLAMHAAMVISAVAIAVGRRTRLAAAVFGICFAWCEAIDVATYLNHYELVTLLAMFAVVLPMTAPRHGPHLVPRWTLWLVRFQVGIVYVFAGLGKLNTDWLAGRPMDIWLAGAIEHPLGAMLSHVPAGPVLASWAGLAFDLAVVPALLVRRTRTVAYVALVGFHAATAWLFPPIGVFPLLMAGCATVFFDPDWPQRLLRLSGRVATTGPTPQPPTGPDRVPMPRWQTVVLSGWVVVHLMVPLRHLAYPGDVRWTEEGYRWSWRVLLTEKVGQATFEITDPHTGVSRTVWPGDELAPHQSQAMATRPDLIRQYARHLADRYEADTKVRPEVRADVWVTMNGRPRQRLIDPELDLAAIGSSLAPAPGLGSI